MKKSTKERLFDAWDYCDKNDKSTEFMLQYMQDIADVELDCVLKFIAKYSNNRPDHENTKSI